MTYQESLWQGRRVLVVTSISKRGNMHRHVWPYLGLTGSVVREAKNGMLLVQFENHTRAIPAGCLDAVSQ